VLSFDALADGIGPAILVDRVLDAVPQPRVAPSQQYLDEVGTAGIGGQRQAGGHGDQGPAVDPGQESA
jgi:hypothetical protein